MYRDAFNENFVILGFSTIIASLSLITYMVRQVAERMNNNAVAKGLENPHLKQFDIVHIKCRKVLERDDNRHGAISGDAGPSHDRSSRSSEPMFDFKNCCLYCGLGKTNHGTIDARKRDKIRYVRTLIKQNAIQRAIDRRTDSWGLKVYNLYFIKILN